MNMPYTEFACRQQGQQALIDHRHVNADSYEIILVLSGSGSILLLDRTWPLQPGALVLIDASSPHCIRPDNVGGYLRSKVIVDKAFLQQFLLLSGARDTAQRLTDAGCGFCLYLDQNGARRAQGCFTRMERAWQSGGDTRALGMLDGLLPLLTLLFSPASNPETTPLQGAQDRLSPVLTYLRARCAESLTMEQIAADNHISKYYLCRLFRQQTGLTIMQYVSEQRLALARRLLTETEWPVSTVAQNCGFGSSSHFCTFFRRREGLSPHLYRAARRAK